MIINFKNKETKKIFNREYSKDFSLYIQNIAYRKLLMIDASFNLLDLKIPPSNHLEKLSDKLKGKYSIRINNQFRIVFEWINNNAYNVEIIDYH